MKLKLNNVFIVYIYYIYFIRINRVHTYIIIEIQNRLKMAYVSAMDVLVICV